MAGINRTGKPRSADYLLGRGSIEIAPLDSVTGKPLGFRHLGNCTAFSLNIESEKLEHQNSRTGVRTIDREIVLSQKVNVSVTLDEALNFENLALFFAGTASTITNPAAAGGVTDQLVIQAGAEGRSYELRKSDGSRLMDINSGSLTVKSGTFVGGAGAATTLTGAGNIEIDPVWGTIFIPSGSSFVDGHAIWFSYTSAGTEKAVDMVTLQTTSKVSYFLRFKAINPADNDRKILLDLHSVSLAADGDFNWIGEEFAELTLTGVAERNETGYSTAPTGRIYYHGDA